MLSEVSSRFLSVERGDDAVIRAVFCADPRPIRVSWRWAAFQMEAGSGSGRFVAEALHKVTPTILPPMIELVNDDNDDETSSSSNNHHRPQSITQLANDTAAADVDDAELRGGRFRSHRSALRGAHHPAGIVRYIKRDGDFTPHRRQPVERGRGQRSRSLLCSRREVAA